MREIKFRGKQKDNGKWVYGNLAIDFDGNCIIFTGDIADYYAQTLYEVEEKSVGQFTGLYDATRWEELTNDEQALWLATKKTKEEWKGKEIYEGDVVKYDDYSLGCFLNRKQPRSTGEIFWELKYAQWQIKGRLAYGFTECEVIGNTTDNPELMEAI